MNEEDRLGEKICHFLTKKLLEDFKKLPKDIGLKLCINDNLLDDMVCSSSSIIVSDSRLKCKENEECGGNEKIIKKVVWVFVGKQSVKDSIKEFLEFLLRKLEKKFSDLLFLKEVEERINNEEDKIVKYFIGELIDKEWVVRHFIDEFLEKNNLPSLELLNQISAQKYEQRAVKTSFYFYSSLCETQKIIMLAKQNFQNWEECGIQLSANELRSIRKMMEMSSDNYGLIALNNNNGYYIVGMISNKNSSLPSIQIEFLKHLNWKIKYNNEYLFEYDNGVNTISIIENKDIWIDELGNIKNRFNFPIFDSSTGYNKTVENVVNKLKKQKHGTSIVFMDDYTLKKEVKRLAKFNRAYQMKPFSILDYKDAILGISAVDGAILADITGQCYATSVILDGKAVIKGDTGRGARYNSVVNYINWVYKKYRNKAKKKKIDKNIWCFAIIISEDETINFEVPNLDDK